jgi:hypothetical protein
MDLTTCPECRAPAEIVDRAVLDSTDGPIEHARVRCIARHAFFLPVERLSSFRRGPARRSASPTARRNAG